MFDTGCMVPDMILSGFLVLCRVLVGFSWSSHRVFY